jgi:asparagine synthase (glutamine-hydrolysing)
MCGIAGVVSTNVEKSAWVKGAVKAISHRGPDESGFFSTDGYACGMCRLSIIDVASGHQPNFNAQETVVSVFNGEIYNFQELRTLLLRKGFPVRGEGDSALIPYLYEEFGEGFPEKLQGMFAIAIYDTRKQKLILVRDRLGKKPLWYSSTQDNFAFCSENKGLVQLGVAKSFDTSIVSEYLQFGYINAPRSAFKNVFQVKPGSVLVVEKNQIRETEFWNPSSIPDISIDFEDAKRETIRLLREAVKSRLISERPLGAFLSGGIDSTIVSAIMKQESQEDVNTYSIGFDDQKFDESKYARSVANHLETTHHEKIVHPDSELLVTEILEVLDQPFADSSIIPTYLLSKFTRQEVVVALSGDGGDEVFGGYLRYRAGKYLDAVNPFLRLNPVSNLPTGRMNNVRLKKFLKHSHHQDLLGRYIGFQSLFQESDLIEYLNPEVLNQNGVISFEQNWHLSKIKNEIRKMQEIDLRTYLPGDLMHKVDMSSMANSLEVRSPFLDFRVVEFGLSLPSKLKIKFGSNKFILKEIAADFVPRAIIDRPKMGFGIPRARWLREEFNSVVHDTLLSPTSLQRGWYRKNSIETILKRHISGENLDHLIWPMLMLELWAKRWLDS